MPEGTIDYHVDTVFRETCSVYPNIRSHWLTHSFFMESRARPYLMGNRQILHEKDGNKKLSLKF